ncbi:putative toxin-antitoxin system toxin component, PIN family [Candidatus Gottesmanbacteria bacterium]|nr:putative toxin-antitoxin system toxin component, PIN family [Candidatus Gottesmanbacteria bacterium]
MKKIVLDTNIYISALHFPQSITRKLFDSPRDSSFELVISKEIISELLGVLGIKFEYTSEKLDLLEELLQSFCEIIEPKKRVRIIKDDPADNKILECAWEGKADIIISGDKHLLKIKTFKGIKIMTPKEFQENIYSALD